MQQGYGSSNNMGMMQQHHNGHMGGPGMMGMNGGPMDGTLA